MNGTLISLYVLLTTPIPVPWTLLIKGSAVILAYTLARPFEQVIGINALNIAVLSGMLATLYLNLPRHLLAEKAASTTLVTVATLVLGLSAVTLFVPAALLPFAIIAGLAGVGAIYGAVLLWDRPLLERMGWTKESWGLEGQANAIRWTILRCIGLATANAYAATYVTQEEWIVTYAVLPVIFYALFHWSIIATHPYEDGV